MSARNIAISPTGEVQQVIYNYSNPQFRFATAMMAMEVIGQSGVFIMGYEKNMRGLFDDAETVDFIVPREATVANPVMSDTTIISRTNAVVEESFRTLQGSPEGREIIGRAIARMMSSMTPRISVAARVGTPIPQLVTDEIARWAVMGNILANWDDMELVAR